MPTYLVESYATGGAVADQRDRAARAARAGAGITYIRTTVVLGDQSVLHLFEAASADELREAARVVALDCDRIVEVVEASAQTIGDGPVVGREENTSDLSNGTVTKPTD
jgi:hypothetical protein